MKSKSLRRTSVVVAAIASMISLSLSMLPANGSETAGISRTEIKLGITVPQTGIAAPGYSKVAPAMKAFFDHVNANGGVYGRKITLSIKDDGYNPKLVVSKTRELIQRDRVFAIVGALGTANQKAVKTLLAQNRVPSLFVNTGFSEFADKKKFPNQAALFPSYLMEAKIMANFIANNPDFKGKKVGIIMQADDFGNDAAKGFAQEKFKFDSTVRYPNGQQGDAKQVDLWIQKLKDDGIGNGDVVIVFGVTTATAAALNAAFNAKFAPQWILGSVGADSTTLSGINRVLLALLNNAIGLSFLPSPTDTSDEYIKLFTEINEKYNNKAVMDFNVVAGMNTAMVMTQALHAAGPNPTRTGLMNALETKGKDFFSAGLTSLGYSTTARVGYNGYYIGRYNARGELKPLNDKVVIYSTDSGTGPVVTSDKIARKPMPDKGLPK